MKPRDSCSSLLHESPLRPDFSEFPHVLEITGREAAHVRKGGFEVVAAIPGPGRKGAPDRADVIITPDEA